MALIGRVSPTPRRLADTLGCTEICGLVVSDSVVPVVTVSLDRGGRTGTVKLCVALIRP